MTILFQRFEEWFWSRHANPKSGWTRVPIAPLVVYALYRRDWRLLVAALVWTGINPVVFPPPDTNTAWMTRGVLAERWWVREEHNGTMGLTYPNICNTVGGIAFAFALYAAWKRRPTGATIATVIGVGLKLWWIGVLVRRFERLEEQSVEACQINRES